MRTKMTSWWIFGRGGKKSCTGGAAESPIEMKLLDNFYAALTALQSVEPSEDDMAKVSEYRMAITSTEPETSRIKAAYAAMEQVLDINGVLDLFERRRKMRKEMPSVAVFETMQMVLPNVFLGPLTPATNRDTLLSTGITHICSCLRTTPCFPNDFSYLVISLNDADSEDIAAHFNNCIEFIHKATQAGGKVYVHCAAGISRSATIVIAYMMYTMRIGFDRAYDIVRSRRPFVCPNAGFRRQLVEFERTLQLV